MPDAATTATSHGSVHDDKDDLGRMRHASPRARDGHGVISQPGVLTDLDSHGRRS